MKDMISFRTYGSHSYYQYVHAEVYSTDKNKGNFIFLYHHNAYGQKLMTQ